MKKIFLLFILMIPLVSATDYVYLSMDNNPLGETLKLDVKVGEEYSFKGTGSQGVTTVYIYVNGEDNLVQGISPELKWVPKEEKTYELDVIGWIDNQRVASQKFYLEAKKDAETVFNPCDGRNQSFFDVCNCLKEKLSTGIFDAGDRKIKIGFTETINPLEPQYYRNGLENNDFAVINNVEDGKFYLYSGLDANKEEINSVLEKNKEILSRSFHNDVCSGYWYLLSLFNVSLESQIPPDTISDSKCVSIHKAGSYEDKYDLVFVADNYEEIQEFERDVNVAIDNAIFNMDTYGAWSDEINIWYSKRIVNVCENQKEGEEDFECNHKETLRVASECPYDAVAVISTKNFRSYSQGEIAFNSLAYSEPRYFASLMAHELGHLIFNFADEYLEEGKDFPIPNEANCYADKDLARITWTGYGLKEGLDFDFYSGCQYEEEYFRPHECTVMGGFSTGCEWLPEIGPVQKAYIDSLVKGE